MAKTGHLFLASAEISQADIRFFSTFTIICAWYKSILGDLPNLAGLYDRLMSEPRLKSQFQKEMKMPMTAQYSDRFKELSKEMKEHPRVKQVHAMWGTHKMFGCPRADGSDYFEAFFD